MKKIFLVLVLSFFMTGCATATNTYTSVFNDSVASGRSITIVKQGDFHSIDSNVNEHLAAVGYEKVLYSIPKDGFLVVVKKESLVKALLVGEPHMYKIILKYTKAGEGKTRIDLVNGSTNVFAKKEVDKDIQKLEGLINSD